MQETPLTISRIAEEAPGFKTFVFAERLSYEAGQYLTFVHPTHVGPIRRSYSIVSSPDADEPLAIGVKRVENGEFSRWLIDRARPGDVLMTTGVGGFFTLPKEGVPQQLFFLAAGSGITPVFSLIKSALVRYPDCKLVLVYSIPSEGKAPYREALLRLQGMHPRQLSIEWRMSNAKNLADARLSREALQLLLKKFEAPFDRQQFFICGPEPYMRLCTYTLQEEGVPQRNIRKEFFFTAAVARSPKPLPPDRQTHQVRIHQPGGDLEFEVQYPDTILTAARKAGIGLPYSCETGRCGACAARCRSGQVWLSYNEVLTDDELARGLTLTCTGHPVGGDVVLEL